ncbi:helix-turn-helix transcriptional regulator [Bradyrhizobium sp. Mp64]|jgi:transcriptional regulator with XRE-family HTH domain|nr:helix-turn-helix transcriptional regulator [Bradyrhizobium sp. Mp64]MDI2110447.1 helix-turn-helix transcriptional regulator [Bradyrhizobium sp. Mp64]
MLGTSATLPPMAATSADQNPESNEAVAHRLKRTREAMKLTQAAWCRLVGIDAPQWNNYETGGRRITIDAALKVCKATGVGLNWIYRGMASDVPVNLATAIQAQERAARKRS